MKQLIFIALICCCLPSMAQTDSVLYSKQPSANHVLAAKLQPLKGETQYLTAELIRINGISRLSELFTWIDKATFSTLQHDRFYLNLNGTSTFQGQNYLVMINGLKIELERWDALYFNQLGIAITDIAYVEITTSPQIINGQFAGQGLINIVTRNDYKGITATGYTNYGNPINDPGPAAHINGYVSPNVHKTGLAQGYTLGYYGSKGHINLNYNKEDWFLRDTLAMNRLAAYGGTAERIITNTIRLESVLNAGKYLLEAGGAASESNGFLYRNYLQSEVPARNAYNEARLRVTRVLKNHAYLRAHAATSISGFRHPGTELADYRYITATTNLEYGKQFLLKGSRTLKTVSGYTIDYKRYSTGTAYLMQHQPYTSLSYHPTKKVLQKLDIALSVFSNTVNPAVAFKHEKKSSSINASSVILSYQQSRLNSVFNQLWHFYGTNRTLGINPAAYPVSINSTPTHLVTADYFYAISSGGSFKITVNPGIRYQHNYHFIRPDQAATFPLISKNTVGQSANFYTITFGTNIHYDVFNNFWFDIDYFSANDKSSDKDLQQVLNSDARRKLAVSFYVKLPARIDAGIRSQAISRTSWTYFDESGQLASARLPAVFTTDLSFNKKLWGDRITLNATIRNLFNQREQYHPIGAGFQMRLFVSAIVKLENLAQQLRKK